MHLTHLDTLQLLCTLLCRSLCGLRSSSLGLSLMGCQLSRVSCTCQRGLRALHMPPSLKVINLESQHDRPAHAPCRVPVLFRSTRPCKSAPQGTRPCQHLVSSIKCQACVQCLQLLHPQVSISSIQAEQQRAALLGRPDPSVWRHPNSPAAISARQLQLHCSLHCHASKARASQQQHPPALPARPAR